MVGITDENGRVLKHYAQDTINRKRYVIIALENQTDPNTCSVIDIDALEPDIRAELVALVNSSECQTVEEIWQILDRKYFMDYPNHTMLKVLKAMRQILVVDSNQVAIQLPGEQTMTPKQVADAIKEYKKKKNGVVQQSFNPESETKVAEPLIEKVGEKEPNKDISELKDGIKNLNDKMNSLVDVLSQLASNMNSKSDDTKKKK